MAKKISKKTFTIFVVLAVIVFIGFLFYSFNKKSNLFEGQATNTKASINKHYPTEDNYDVPIPKSGKCIAPFVDNGLDRCVYPNWSESRADCNDKTYATQAEYDACINNS